MASGTKQGRGTELEEGAVERKESARGRPMRQEPGDHEEVTCAGAAGQAEHLRQSRQDGAAVGVGTGTSSSKDGSRPGHSEKEHRA
jgi:hypothetical protein